MRKETDVGTLRQELSRRGATEQQLATKVVAMAEEAVADGSIDGVQHVRELIKRLTHELEDAESGLRNATANASSIQSRLDATTRLAHDSLSEVIDATEALQGTAREVTISNPDTLDGINAYAAILSNTKAIIGENMTEALWEKAIEAASYGMWRSIMGPKHRQDDEAQDAPRFGRKSQKKAL